MKCEEIPLEEDIIPSITERQKDIAKLYKVISL